MSSFQRSQPVAADLDIRPLAGRIGAQVASARVLPWGGKFTN
jgi:hypothetical protein